MLRRFAPLALLTLSCKPTASAPPAETVAQAEPASSDDGAHSPGAPPSGVTDEPAPPGSAGDGPEPEPGDSASVTPESPEPTNPEPVADAKPSAPEAAAGLPKPLYRNVENSCGRDPGVGSKLKGFKLKNMAGQEVSNGRYRKRVMLVNFWGTWCKPCLKELPEFDRLYRRYRKHGMTLVAIATDEDPEPVQAFIDKRKLRAKVLLGGESYASQYGAPNFPFSYVVDDKGTIIGSYHGFKEECMGKLEEDLRTALERRTAK